jgi:protein-disulfide isomerase-like protein with CxxC motif
VDGAVSLHKQRLPQALLAGQAQEVLADERKAVQVARYQEGEDVHDHLVGQELLPGIDD